MTVNEACGFMLSCSRSTIYRDLDYMRAHGLLWLDWDDQGARVYHMTNGASA